MGYRRKDKLEKNGGYQLGLRKTLGEKDAETVEEARKACPSLVEFNEAADKVNRIKKVVSKYLDDSKSFLEHIQETAENKELTLKEKIWSLVPFFGKTSYKQQSIGIQLKKLVGNFQLYGEKLESELVINQEKFDNLEGHLDNLMEVQERAVDSLESSEKELAVAEDKYNKIAKRYSEAVKDKNQKEAVRLSKNLLEANREVEEIQKDIRAASLGYKMTKNIADATKAYRVNIKVMLSEGEKLADDIHLTVDTLEPLFKYVVGAAKIAELQSKSLDAYTIMKEATNLALPAIADLSRAAGKVRGELMDGNFIESNTIREIKQLGHKAQAEAKARDDKVHKEVKKDLEERANKQDFGEDLIEMELGDDGKYWPKSKGKTNKPKASKPKTNESKADKPKTDK